METLLTVFSSLDVPEAWCGLSHEAMQRPGTTATTRRCCA